MYIYVMLVLFRTQCVHVIIVELVKQKHIHIYVSLYKHLIGYVVRLV